MDNTDFLLNFLLYIPGIIVAIYLTVYTAAHFSFFRPLEKKRNEIRHKVAAQWDKQHGSFIKIIDNIDLEYIRVLLRQRVNEDKLFRLKQGFYVVYSIGIIFVAVFVKSYKNVPSYYNYIMFACVVVFAIASTIIIKASLNEWKFYKLLDELDTST